MGNYEMLKQDEIEKERFYKPSSAADIRAVRVAAGPTGWMVVWPEGNVTFSDDNDSTENNFQKAYNVADESIGPLTEVVIPMSMRSGLNRNRQVRSASNSCEAMYMDN